MAIELLTTNKPVFDGVRIPCVLSDCWAVEIKPAGGYGPDIDRVMVSIKRRSKDGYEAMLVVALDDLEEAVETFRGASRE